MSIGLISLVVLLILVLGGLPTWGFHRYGYRPLALLGFIFLLVLVLVLAGRL